jgi:hypothetical protein
MKEGIKKEVLCMALDLQAIKSGLKPYWQSFLETALNLLSKFLEAGDRVPLHIEEVILKHDSSWTVQSVLKPDINYWVLKHREDLKRLPEFNYCLKKMLLYEVLNHYSETNLQSVLISFVAKYITRCIEKTQSLPLPIPFIQDIFDALYEEYVNALFSLYDEVLILCPLFNFESEVDEIKLEEGLTIRKIRPEEINELNNSIGLGFADIKLWLPTVKFVIEHRLHKTRLEFPMHGVYGDRLIDNVILTLRLLKGGAVWGGVSFGRVLVPWSSGWSVWGRTNGKPPFGPAFKLERKDVSFLKKLWFVIRKVTDPSFLNRYTHVSRAIRWFSKSYSGRDIEDRFVWLILSIEALCSEPGEIRYKLSKRIATCIGTSDEERIKISEEFARIYSGPRNIVHGKNIRIDSETVQKVEDIARKLILFFILFSLNNYDREDALKLIDNSLLSEQDRKRLREVLDFDKVYERIYPELVKELSAHESEKVRVLLALIEELKHIKGLLEDFRGYQSVKEAEEGRPPRYGLVYTLIKLHNLYKSIPNELWYRIEGFYQYYRSYLFLLNKAVDRVRKIIRDEITKIKTEKDAEEWRQRVLAKLRAIHGPYIADAGGIGYYIEQFLKYEKPKLVPKIAEDQYLLFDPTYSGWDMKITLEDLRRANTSLHDFLKKIHDRVNSDEVVRRVRERRNQMIKLVSDLTSELEQYINTLVNEVCTQ